VLALLARQECCLSAQDIHDRLRAGSRKPVGLASVYRALDVLAQLKLVHRIDVDGTACYEPADPSGDHHHHVICDECGKMDSFEDPELERLIDGLGARLGYEVGGHDVVLRGACPDCADR
jgi:Fur family transcriptional regulator, ferric uptake regulator